VSTATVGVTVSLPCTGLAVGVIVPWAAVAVAPGAWPATRSTPDVNVTVTGVAPTVIVWCGVAAAFGVDAGVVAPLGAPRPARPPPPPGGPPGVPLEAADGDATGLGVGVAVRVAVNVLGTGVSVWVGVSVPVWVGVRVAVAELVAVDVGDLGTAPIAAGVGCA
jgi:hypothetical protein